VFTLINSPEELPAATFNNIGQFALVTGGDLYIYVDSCCGSTGPSNRYNFVGNIGDSLLTGPSGGVGATGPQGATGTFDGTVPFIVEPPVNVTSLGQAGTIAYDADYLYVCIARNTWRRSFLRTF
jgi:hypothetical protein